MQTPSKLVLMNNGLKMPHLGLGTYLAKDEAEISNFSSAIIEFGYRHIDTASYYQNEAQIGQALKIAFSKGVPREELFIVTKLWNNDHGRVEAALKESLSRLQLDYVDLYLVHWPVATVEENGQFSLARIPLAKTWADMEACVDKGLAKSIGVSNFNFQSLNDLLSYARIRPVCNQIELNPYLTQFGFVEWMKEEKIIAVSYAPLGKAYLVEDPNNIVINNPLIIALAEKYGKTAGQILLNWGLARGHVVIPKTSHKHRLKENYDAQNFEMAKEDVDEITKLNRNFRLLAGTYRKGIFVYPIFE